MKMKHLSKRVRNAIQANLDNLVSSIDTPPETVETIRECISDAVVDAATLGFFKSKQYCATKLAEQLMYYAKTCCDPMARVELELMAEEISLMAMNKNQYREDSRYRNEERQ